MTKEEFLKKALGAQYTEKEAGLLDRVAKKNLGAQYTESEMKAMSDPLIPLINGEPPFVAQFRNPMPGPKTGTDAYGEPIVPIDVNQLTQQFYSILGSMDNKREQERVIQIFQMSDDEGKINFMQHIVGNPALATGYGIQDETFNLGFN